MIGANVFRGKNISKVTLGANVTSIGEYAFYDCNFLTEVGRFASATAANGLTVGDYAVRKMRSTVLHFPARGHDFDRRFRFFRAAAK